MRSRKRQPKVAILIAGAHRSGTSALTRVLHLLGCELPKTLLPANAGNEKEHWESPLVSQFNDKFMAIGGVDWRAWQQFPDGWAKQPAVAALKAEALAILEGEFGTARLFVLKDPRICRLIRFWREVLEAFEARPVVACPIRNPLEVAASLENRDALVPAVSHLIWLRYVLDAEFSTRGMPRTFASYDELLTAWRPMAKRIGADLGVSWPRSPEQAAPEIDAFLSAAHRHHNISAESVTKDLGLPEWLRTTYAILDRWARERESRGDLKTLDRIRLRLDKIPPDLRPIIAAGHVQMERARRLKIRFEREAPEQARRDAEANATAAQLADVMTQLADTARQFARRDAEASANAAQLTEVKTQLSENARQLAQRDAVANANAEQLNEIRAQLAHTAGELAKREAEATTKMKQLKEATAASKRLTHELEHSKAELAHLHRQMEDARREAKGLESELRRIRSSRAWKFVQASNSAARAAAGILQRLRILSNDPAKKTARLLAASGLFDGDWYLTQNPDVAAAGIDPALHYVRHGAAEGRDPGPNFDTRWYLDTCKDVAAEGMNPLLHFLLHGRAQGRAIALSSAAPAMPAIPTEPPVAALDPLSFPLPRASETSWIRQEEIARTNGLLLLELSGLNLATVPVREAESEGAWMAIADPARALVTFCRLMSTDPRQILCCHIGAVPFEIATKLDALMDPAACPVVSFQCAAAEVTIADIWYINDRDLRLRFSAEGGNRGQACVARFFQYDLSSDRRLSMVGESVLDAGAAAFADITLTNAFLPVLMTLATPEAHLLSASLLPFPSLCRGGVHYGELRATFTKVSYLESLQAASSSLLAEMLGGAAATADFSVARIEVDLQRAIGSERIFSTEIREWLATVLHLGVRPANASAVANRKVRAHLEERLASVAPAQVKEVAERITARERSGAVALVLPADAVPSLHALVSRALGVGPGMAPVVGSFVVAEDSTAKPRWAVTIPAMGAELLALQPTGAGVSYPVLTGLAPQGHGGVARNIERRPLAVRFCDTRDRHPASLIMPVAPDAPGPLLQRVASSTVGQHAMISIILAPSHQRNDAFAALLESLKLQTMGESVEIIAIVDAAQAGGKHAAENALRRFFPAKYRLIAQDSDPSPNARINHAAEHAAGKFLLIASANIALHDPRTLETLCAIADHDKVASAGCVLLRASGAKKLQTAVFRSGGIFPSTPLRPEMCEPVFSEPDCLDVFRIATYPVVGNSSALFMVRSDVWRTLGGFDATNFPNEHGDIEYGVRAIATGYFHLCTSVVSAELYDRDFRASYADEALQSMGPSESWRSIISSASLIEALNA